MFIIVACYLYCYLTRLLKKIGEDLGSLSEGELKNLGIHSFRKGSTSFVLGIPGGPSAPAVYLNAGWSLGRTQDTYIFVEGGAQHTCGRAVAGLDMNSSNFASLAPHFYLQEAMSRVEHHVVLMFPRYHQLPASFQQCLPIFVAQLVYHADFLKSVLPPTHPLFDCYLFRTLGVLEELKPLVTIEPKVSTVMTPSGVPGAVAALRAVEGHVVTIREQLAAAKAERIHCVDELKTFITDKISGGGVSADRLEAMLRGVLSEHMSIAPPLNSDAEDLPSSPLLAEYPLHTWNGQIHRLPKEFEVASGATLERAWSLWCLGNPVKKVPPYRTLSPSDFGVIRERNKFSVWTSVFKSILQLVGDDGFGYPRTDNDVVASFLRLDTITSQHIIPPSSVRKRKQRDGELTMEAIYRHVREYKKRVRTARVTVT